MILLYVNVFKDTTKDQNFLPHEQKTNSVIFNNNSTRTNLIILKNILVRRNQKEAFTEALFYLKKARPSSDPILVLSETLSYLKPLVAFRFKKVAGVRYRLPFMKTANSGRDQFQAVCWLLNAATTRSKNSRTPLGLSICEEVLDVEKRRGSAVNERLSYHKTALLQRPFLKFL